MLGNSFRSLGCWITLLALLAVPSSARADVLFTLDGVPGTSLLARPPAPNAIGATGFSFVAAVPAGAKAVAQDLVITRRTDRATPAILNSMVSGARLKNAQLFVVGTGDARGAGGSPVLYKISMTDAMVAAVKHSVAEGDPNVVLEQITLEFARAEVEVFTVDPKGILASGGKASISGRRP